MKKSKAGRIFLKTIKWFLIAMLALILTCVIYIVVQISRATDINEISIMPDGYLTSILDQDGNVTRTLAGEEANRIYCTIDKIPADVQNAFIAIEDERFYSHNGIDLRGIARAFFRGITSGNFSEGASTITQQLIKNSAFDGWTEENTFLDSLNRKIQEQYLALQLEKKYDKQYILEVYLNTINLGSGTWGVQAAANRYFGKDVADLSLSEAAVIAGITKNPSAYDPIEHPDTSRERYELVLAAMLDQQLISEEAYQQALADNVFERIASDHTDRNTTPFSYFEDALLLQVVSDLQEQKNLSEEEAWDLIYRGGLMIYSTEDTDIQKICENAVNNESYCSGEEQVSCVVMDPSTGYVRAIVGGRGEKTSSLIYNRATDSIRQPGSTIKVLGEYAAAFEDGKITLGTTIDDAPYTYTDGTEIHNSDGIFHGMTTIRDAIANSYNVVALKVFQEQGMDRVCDTLENFGLTSLDYSQQTEAMAIGGTNGGVTTMELTAAYNALANSGTYQTPLLYTSVTDTAGNVILSTESQQKKAVSEQTAQMLTCALQEVIDSGTGVLAGFNGVPIAGKSGTTNENRDLWFVGYSPYYTCGVWGGFDSNAPQENTDYVKLIWKEIMETANSEKEYASFPLSANTEIKNICVKCGQLARTGLCDETAQGDMTREEVFIKGTGPTVRCSCHTTVRLCSVSGERAGSFCPSWAVSQTIYLKTASAGTTDEAYAADTISTETCDRHTSLWNLFGGNSQDTEEEDSTVPSQESEISPEEQEQTPGTQEMTAPDDTTQQEDAENTETPEDTSEEESPWWEQWWSGLWG